MPETTATPTYNPIPETVAEALERWDAGETVFTVSMGGLGPGYEQCIHILVFEIIRDHLATGKPLPDDGADEWETWGDGAVHRLDPEIGFSGAQVGAAKNVAARTLKLGWRAAIREVPDRQIQVSRQMPSAPPLPQRENDATN